MSSCRGLIKSHCQNLFVNMCMLSQEIASEIFLKVFVQIRLARSSYFIYQVPCLNFEEIQSSLYLRYYIEACNKWRVHLRGSVLGQRTCEKTLPVWRIVSDTVPDLTEPGIKPQTSDSDVSDLLNSGCFTKIISFDAKQIQSQHNNNLMMLRVNKKITKNVLIG